MDVHKEKVSFVDLYTRTTEPVIDEILTDFRQVVKESQFILGDPVASFEREFAALCRTKHAISCNSGLDALILALRSLGIGPGDEVITASNSFVASAAAIDLVGARTVFADVGDDFNLDPAAVERVLTPQTKAIMPVHLTGNPCRMAELRALARDRDIAIVEDAAQAVGALYEKKPVGGLGKIGCFSLHPLKNLHAWGDGGVMTTDDDETALILKKQRNHGMINRDEVEFFSYNSRLDTLQAIVVCHFLKHLEVITEKRIRHASLYRERLSELGEYVRMPLFEARSKPVYHVFQLRVTDRDGLKNHLLAHGIETKVHYPIPIHLQKAASHLGYKRGDLPVTERLAGEILSVPVRENLEEDTIDRISELIKKFYRGRS